MCARAAMGDKALDYLEKYLSFTGRNGFHLNGDQSGKGLSDLTYRPFTLEGNFLAMQAVHEMLLQSWGGVVRVFPATSERWPDVSFEDLRAEGGFRVWGTRSGGQTTVVSVRATKDSTLRLRDPFSGREATWNRAAARVGANYEIELKAGEQFDGAAPAASK
jgi:alpha-L-fucosidase 2